MENAMGVMVKLKAIFFFYQTGTEVNKLDLG